MWFGTEHRVPEDTAGVALRQRTSGEWTFYGFDAAGLQAKKCAGTRKCTHQKTNGVGGGTEPVFPRISLTRQPKDEIFDTRPRGNRN